MVQSNILGLLGPRLVDAYAAVQVAWTAQGCCNLCTVLFLYEITFFGVTLEHVSEMSRLDCPQY